MLLLKQLVKCRIKLYVRTVLAFLFIHCDRCDPAQRPIKRVKQCVKQ